MTFTERLRCIKRIDHLAQMKATGNVKQLTQTLGVSRTSLFRYIDDLKELGAPIVYCRDRETYLYEENFELIF